MGKQVVEAEIVDISAIEEKRESANNLLAVINEKSIAENMVESVRNISIVKKEDVKFLSENAQHLSTVCQKTFIWRTHNQKLSILHDDYQPTTHAKFHQSILEQKVFFEQAVQLAKEAEELKLKLEKLMLDQEELQEQLDGGFIYNEKFEKIPAPQGSPRWKRLEVKMRENDLDINAKRYQLQNCSVAMDYRMREIKDWKQIQDQLMHKMLVEEGYTEEEIWDKEAGEAEAHFFLFLKNFQAVHQSKDSGEIQNLAALARHGVDQAIGLGKFDEWKKRCNEMQLKSLVELGYVNATPTKDGKGMLFSDNKVEASELYKTATIAKHAAIEHKKE